MHFTPTRVVFIALLIVVAALIPRASQALRQWSTAWTEHPFLPRACGRVPPSPRS